MKIAYGAGHYFYESGRRIPEEFDRNQTREWVLNDRVARYFAEAASQYNDVELLRVDDPSGEEWITLSNRCEASNEWGADFFLSIHHNAGANMTKAGGVVAYILSESSPAKPYQKAIYDCVIRSGKLAGNRVSPLAVANFQVLRQTNCPAVLMEYGFMDSAIDAKIIVNDEYSKAVGYATMEGIAKVAGLKKKEKKEFVAINLDVLKKGASNAQVYAVQTMLNGFIGADIAFDGYFGSQTEQAVKNYQSKRGLPVTGVVDEATWVQLLKK